MESIITDFVQFSFGTRHWAMLVLNFKFFLNFAYFLSSMETILKHKKVSNIL